MVLSQSLENLRVGGMLETFIDQGTVFKLCLSLNGVFKLTQIIEARVGLLSLDSSCSFYFFCENLLRKERRCKAL